MTTREFLLAATGVTVFAFAVREWHILASVIPNPAAGDVSSYLNYALNMAWEGVYTMAGDGEPIVPDAYRSPGYPIFLLGVLKLSRLKAWYPAVYHAQAVVGALGRRSDRARQAVVALSLGTAGGRVIGPVAASYCGDQCDGD